MCNVSVGTVKDIETEKVSCLASSVSLVFYLSLYNNKLSIAKCFHDQQYSQWCTKYFLPAGC